MKGLIFEIRLNSLYSIRISFTWQSALTYPILPPSSIIGLVANALQRYKNDKPPKKYLEEVENNVIWAGSRLLTPCVIKSYTTSAITKWEDFIGGKFTNALGRQFAYARKIEILLIVEDSCPIEEWKNALLSVPLTCGDSESVISIESKPREVPVKVNKYEKFSSSITSFFPVPFVKDCEVFNGTVYLMHKRCFLKKSKNLPLYSYLCPVKSENNILKPTEIEIRKLNAPCKIFEVDGIGYVVDLDQ